MVSNQNAPAKIVWINEQEKIASFHHVDGYCKHIYIDHEHFMEFLRSLQQQGFRFQ